MSENKLSKTQESYAASLDDVQKRRLRAVRRAYRAESLEIKDNGWSIEVKYMDGSSVTVDAKMLKLKADELKKSSIQ